MAQTTKGRNAALSLHELQSQMQAAILDGGDDFLSLIRANSRTDTATLFGVYRNAYRARLVEILANEYPLSRRLVGIERFEQAAIDFINANPSRTPNARWFGNDFPRFLAASATGVELRMLSELAAIEKALSDAFDAADGPVIGLNDLAEIAPEEWSRLTFAPQITSSRLEIRTNAFDAWKALKDDLEAPSPKDLNDGERLIVWRQDSRPLIRLMAYEESMMWTEACLNVPFGVLCEMIATFDDPENAPARAAGYLQGWLVSGLLSAVTVPPARQAASRLVALP